VVAVGMGLRLRDDRLCPIWLCVCICLCVVGVSVGEEVCWIRKVKCVSVIDIVYFLFCYFNKGMLEVL